MFDLFGTNSKVRGIEKQMLEAARASSSEALYQTPKMDFFPAKLTAYDSATGYYSWTEQFFTTAGVRENKSDARTGTHTYMPAKLLNGAVISTFPFQVWLMRTIVSDTLGPIYEAVAALPFEEMDLIDKICVTKNSGVVTDINIQRRTYLVAAYLTSEVGTCSTSDADCCDLVDACSFCPAGEGWPRELNLHIDIDSGAIVADITLTYSASVASGCSVAGWRGCFDPSGLGGCGGGSPSPCQFFWFGCDPAISTTHPVLKNGCVSYCVNTDVADDFDCSPLSATGVATFDSTGGILCGATIGRCVDTIPTGSIAWTVTE